MKSKPNINAKAQGRPPTNVSNEAILAAAPLHKDACKAKTNKEFSLGDHYLDDFTKSEAAEQSHACYLNIPLRWFALTDIVQDLSVRRFLWYALLAEPGFLLWKKDASVEDCEGMVIGGDDHAVVTIPVRCRKLRTQCFAQIEFPKDKFSYKMLTITQATEYKALPAKVVHQLPTSGQLPTGLLLALGEKIHPSHLYKCHARNGYKNLTIERFLRSGNGIQSGHVFVCYRLIGYDGVNSQTTKV